MADRDAARSAERRSRGQKYAQIVDPDLQYAARPETSSRHRVKNNLPGTPDFCPLVFRTEALERFIAMEWRLRAQDAVAAVPRDLLARTAAFLLLKDSKSSFAIEGEHPPQDRIQRWGRAIGEAGRQPIDLDELLRLQRIVIGDAGSSVSVCGTRAVSSANGTANRACRYQAISAPDRNI